MKLLQRIMASTEERRERRERRKAQRRRNRAIIWDGEEPQTAEEEKAKARFIAAAGS